MTDAPDQMRAAAEAALPKRTLTVEDYSPRAVLAVLDARDSLAAEARLAAKIIAQIAARNDALTAERDAMLAEVARHLENEALLSEEIVNLRADLDAQAERLRMAREALTDAVRSGRLGVVSVGAPYCPHGTPMGQVEYCDKCNAHAGGGT